MKQAKNYIGFVNDHSGSMASLKAAAMRDYNANIAAIRDGASADQLDTIVSVTGIGFPNNDLVTHQIVNSNPHVLKPVTEWPTLGGTPLYDGIGALIRLIDSLPDANSPHVSVLIMVTTDGEELSSKLYTRHMITELMRERMATDRWTFVFRVPCGARSKIECLGIPAQNIQEWDTTTEGMQASTAQTTTAMRSYISSRASGQSASTSFYANTSKVDVKALKKMDPKEVSLYVVPNEDNGIEIQKFILRHRQKYLKGSAFYQLTKTEARVGPDKQIMIRDRNTGDFYAGAEARQMLGLPSHQNTRLHPGDHGNFDLFIQSESINRKLVGGTGVAYVATIGVEFTQAELDRFKPAEPKPAGKKTPKAAKPAVVQLPKVAPTNKPTKSPIPVTPRFEYFETREEARAYCRANNISQTEIKNDKNAPKGTRWSVLKKSK